MTVQRDIRYRLKDGSRIYLPELLMELDKLNAPDATDEMKLDAIHLAEAFIKTDKDREMLTKHWIEALYHPAVKFELPDEVPPYDNSAWQDFDMAPSTLQAALRHVHYFVKGTPGFIKTRTKREHFYIQTVESLYRKDATLFDAILLKKFPSHVYKNIGIEFLYKVYPQFFIGINVEEIAKTEAPTVKKEPVAKPKPKPKAKAPAKRVTKSMGKPTKEDEKDG